MLRGILFDFNGVLLDDEALHFELFRRVLGEEGVELDSDLYYRELVHYDDVSGFRHVLQQSGYVPNSETLTARVVELCRRKAIYYRELADAAPCPFFAGAAELVRSAAGSGLVIGVVSGALRQEIESALFREGLMSLVRVVVAAEDVPASKPDPSGYRLGHDGLNATTPRPQPPLQPGELLAIEDTAEGVAAAAAAGLRTLGVAHTLPLERLAAADWTVEALSLIRLDELCSRFVDNSATSHTRRPENGRA